MIYQNSQNLIIGSTPVYKMQSVFRSSSAQVWLKLEHLNPGGSIKDRVALAMIEDAESKGILSSGGHIIEPTSGNTGIALAMISAQKGYKCTIVMPENMSVERIRLIRLYGATIVLTPADLGMTGAIEEAFRLQNEQAGAWIPMQFENPVNEETHEKTTAQEIIGQFPDGIDVLVAAVGTGGHLMGVGRSLKNKFPKIKIFAVEPADSAVLSGRKPGQHQIQGIGAGFIPKSLDVSLIDDIICVENNEAIEMMKKLAKTEGLAVGISSGAVVSAIEKILPTLSSGMRVLSFTYDIADRYLSAL